MERLILLKYLKPRTRYGSENNYLGLSK